MTNRRTPSAPVPPSAQPTRARARTSRRRVSLAPPVDETSAPVPPSEQQPRAGARPTRAPRRRAPLAPPFGDWRTVEHNDQRRVVIHRVLHLMLQRRPYADAAMRARFGQMAVQLESQLYFTAPSLAYHIDLGTLPTRVQDLARDINSGRSPIFDEADIAETAWLFADLATGPSAEPSVASVNRPSIGRVAPTFAFFRTATAA